MQVLKTALLVLLVGIAATALAAQGVARKAEGKAEAKEEKKDAEKAEVTAAAKTALQKLAGDATIKVEAEGKNWKAEWEANDKDHEAIVDAEGKLIRSEEDIDAKDAPEAVRTAAAKQFGEDTFVEFTKITIAEGNKTYYEADSKKGDAFFDANGVAVDEDDIDGDDDDEEDEDDDDGEEDDDDDEEGDDD